MRTWIRSVVDAFLGIVPGKSGRLDTATRMSLDADFSDSGQPTTLVREPNRKIDQIEELQRTLNCTS
jgi:hypothetical protein